MSAASVTENPAPVGCSGTDAPVGFSGSYAPEDVTFLLQRVEQPFIDVASKERLLQTRERHYSELLSPEHAPSAEYLAAFERACASNGDRLAGDVLQLARIVAERANGPIALVSLARAGTPIGVLLRRMLTERFGREVAHFSISIIAGRGIDEEALDVVRAQPGIDDAAIVFVDGWTGKGVIGRALTKAVTEYNASRGAQLDPTLHVVVDLCGSTPAASTANDYLIPSCLLGATVSGLVSRSILNEHTRASGRFHGCRYYGELEPADRSRPFVDELHRSAALLPLPAAAPAGSCPEVWCSSSAYPWTLCTKSKDPAHKSQTGGAHAIRSGFKLNILPTLLVTAAALGAAAPSHVPDGVPSTLVVETVGGWAASGQLGTYTVLGDFPGPSLRWGNGDTEPPHRWSTTPT
jgi:hypothetical protein